MIRSPKFIAAAGVVVLAVLAFLAFGVFGIHTAFIDETVSEDNPFANVTTAAVVDDSSGAAQDVVAEPAQASEPVDTEGTAAPVEEAAVAADPDTDAETEPVTEAAAPTAEPAVPQIVTLGTGMLVDHDHSGTGTATVLSDGTQTFLRFEDDFAVDNGPDLNVYLVRGADAEGDPGLFDDDFIDLGDLKGNIGAQNYEVPAGTDISEYNTVVIWCVRFGVAFNAANLA